MPDAAERTEHLRAADVADGHSAEVRQRMASEAGHPIPRVLRMTPAAILVLPYPLGGFGEGGYAVGATFLGYRIAARPGDLPVDERLFTRFPQ